MPKESPLTLARVREALSYDPETGKLTWLIDPAKNVKAGTEAGCAKGVRVSKKTGLATRYIYIRLDNTETPAARVAWLLHYGAWPLRNVLFRDGDTQNLRIGNLHEAETGHIVTSGDGIKNRKMSKEAQRHYGLKRFYGLTGEEYGAMLAAQRGLCAICDKPETVVIGGQIKAMSVDHSHADGKIRGLLCNSCNHLLGHAREDRDILISAIRYLDKHSASAPNVVPLTSEGTF